MNGPEVARAVRCRISPRRQNVIPLLVGLLATPFFVVVHEGTHWVAARSCGTPAELHYRETTVHYDHLPPPPSDLWVVAAGPFVQALLAGGGLFWLYRLRQARRLNAATCADWLATWIALNGGRWLGVPPITGLHDEVLLMKAWGVPVRLGLVLLALTAITLLVATIRIHPPGGRLVPFTYAGLGGVAGVLLWMHWLGPLLLP